MSCRIRTWLRTAGVLVLVLVAALAACVQIQQRILRWRAERLLADVRAIQMGKSTWVDAQRLIKKWGAWGGYEGSCTVERCDYLVALRDSSQQFPAYFPSGHILHDSGRFWNWMNWPYRLLGGHVVEIGASFQIKAGILWTKGFEVEILRYPLAPTAVSDDRYVLAAIAHGMTNLHSQGFVELPVDTPEYGAYLAPICSGCNLVRAYFTPQADPHLIENFLSFDLSCLTRWVECKSAQELAPSMAKIAHELYSGHVKLAVAGNADAFPLEILARDYHYAAIAVAIGPASLKPHLADTSINQPSFRILTSLKNHAVFHSQVLHDRQVQKIWNPRARDGEPYVVPPGTKVILLFDVSPDEIDRISLGEVVVPFTEANLAEVHRGIIRDALADVP